MAIKKHMKLDEYSLLVPRTKPTSRFCSVNLPLNHMSQIKDASVRWAFQYKKLYTFDPVSQKHYAISFNTDYRYSFVY